MVVLTELRESWAQMFNSIDSFVEKANKISPELAKQLDRKSIQKAMVATRKLDALLTEAKKQSDANKANKNQEKLFNE
tara:strand:- start:6659 stop:6892 length:234 start_codon:yes stop_codon:yes gene_type:complete